MTDEEIIRLAWRKFCSSKGAFDFTGGRILRLPVPLEATEHERTLVRPPEPPLKWNDTVSVHREDVIGVIGLDDRPVLAWKFIGEFRLTKVVLEVAERKWPARH